GGPVRLVTPGFYATMNVKWLTKLRFEAEESSNHHHVGRYRTPRVPIQPGSKFTSTLANSDANWNMKIKSVIFSPLNDEIVPAGKVKVSGVAWNDGLTRIETVEVSTDIGQTWQTAVLRQPKSPFAWYPWSITVDLRSGPRGIRCRAIDGRGRGQP